MSDKRDYYEVLGVKKSASSGDLKNAFRRLARKPTLRNGSKKFKKPTPCFPMNKNGPTTIVLVTMVLKAVPLEALAVVVSTSTSKTFSALTSSRRFSAEVPVDGGPGAAQTFC